MTNLENILVQHLGATYRPLSDLSNPPCVTSNLPAIEFDKVKTNFCIPLGHDLKSADGLYIDKSKKIIFFVEFKNIGLHIKNYGSRPKFFAEFTDFQIKQHQAIRQKLSDSLLLIFSASGKYSANTTDVSDMLDRRKVKIYYTVVAPMSDKDFTLYNLALNLAKPIRHAYLAGVEYQARFITSDAEFNTYVGQVL